MSEQDITTDFLKRLLANHDDRLAEERLAEVHPSSLAPLLADLGPPEIQRLIDLLFVRRRAAALLADLKSRGIAAAFFLMSGPVSCINL